MLANSAALVGLHVTNIFRAVVALAAAVLTPTPDGVMMVLMALPTLAIYHFLDNRVAAITLQMEWLVAELNAWLDSNPPSVTPGQTAVEVGDES